MAAMDVYLDERGKPLTMAGQSTKDAERAAAEAIRKREAVARRMYLEGRQYDAINEARASALNVPVSMLAEHEKLHAYSTQIGEAVEYMASQMAEGFEFSAVNSEVEEILLTALKATPDFRGAYGESDLSLVNVVRESLTVSDSPCQVLWDPVEETAYCEFWDTELVEFVYDERRSHILEKVVTRQSVWDWTITGDPIRKMETTEYYVQAGIECVKVTRFDEEAPHSIENLGVPFIPWTTLRAKRKSARRFMRGESVITEQGMRTADRFNAIEQIGFLIARYNSHGNLAVIGDGATLKAQLDERISKDIADILTFPGGTALQVLTLPTDPQMLVHQADVLTAALFGSFGLNRVDETTVTGLAPMSGYALEILNRKTNGTFSQIKDQFIGDLRALLNMILDVTAYKRDEVEDLDALVDPETTRDPEALEEAWSELNLAVMQRLDEIDPMTVFPESVREFVLHVGSGYVVDRAQLRDDFTAGLISRGEYLRQAGYTKEEIKVIEQEIAKDKPKEPEAGLSAGAIAAASGKLAIEGAASKPPVAAEDE